MEMSNLTPMSSAMDIRAVILALTIIIFLDPPSWKSSGFHQSLSRVNLLERVIMCSDYAIPSE